MPAEFVAWLRAQFDDDERRERGKYSVRVLEVVCPVCPVEPSQTISHGCGEVEFDCGHSISNAEFTERFCEPAPDKFVLADIDAKRRIIDEFRWWWDRPDREETDADLHERFAHPDYEYATTEGQRKAWDHSDVPPYGDDGEPDHSWQRNVDAGDSGWERFDYTEESYWRRRIPAAEIERRRQAADRPPMVLRLLALPYAGRDGYRDEWRA